MKVVKIVGHPVLVMSFFLLLLISGESFGGFYAIYILLGLPHLEPDSILAVIGLAAMLAGYKFYRKNFNVLKPLLCLLGSAVMIYSLVVFFKMSKGYNDPTFHQIAPLISFSLFGMCVLCNVLLSLTSFLKPHKENNRLKVA